MPKMTEITEILLTLPSHTCDPKYYLTQLTKATKAYTVIGGMNMIVLIHTTIDDDNDYGAHGSKGRAARFETIGRLEIVTEKGLCIKAAVRESLGSTKRAGNTKTRSGRVTLELSKQDLDNIVRQAIKAHLVPMPGSKAVVEAIRLLNGTTSEMGVEESR